MSILQKIQDLGLQELVLAKNHQAIAEALSANTTQPKPTEIGKGTILSVLGLVTGNAFLDVIDNVADYRHVKDIVAQGKFDVSLEVSKEGILAMVPSVLTQTQADALIALGVQPVVVTAQEVAQAIELGA